VYTPAPPTSTSGINLEKEYRLNGLKLGVKKGLRPTLHHAKFEKICLKGVGDMYVQRQKRWAR